MWIACTCVLSFAACNTPQAESSQSTKVEPTQPAKAEPPAPSKAEPPRPTKAEPPAPVPAQPLSFTLGTRTFTAATALSSRFNDQRRIIISSQPMTCDAAEAGAMGEIDVLLCE